MRPYTYFKGQHALAFYIAGFPDIDPNVSYRMEELRQEGLTCGQITKIGEKSKPDEARECFGEKIDVITNAYDLGKIAAMYDLDSKTIRKNQYTSTSVIFGDGKKLVTITKEKIRQCYTKTVIDARLVYSLQDIATVSDVSIFEYLEDNFVNERNIIFEEDGIYRLSYKQLSHIQKMLPDINLIGKYDNENGGNIFVKWTDILNVVVGTDVGIAQSA